MGHILKLFQCKEKNQEISKTKLCVNVCVNFPYQGKKIWNMMKTTIVKKKLYDVFHTIISRIYYCTWK